ncbi:M28 family peptidase [Glaciecola sp. MH2013]|uniref:M28 family metallopeptidase n=1 Tax=Glaciecola sp. MH2013 TaxID=2785524 RepID=UPI0018A06EBB|nr:M28 family metallopeptidase [Glaciecola sp. MH2013]MBF7073350.1 M28 family peptidase [Glaciecola sp. MH2013]
MNRSINALLKTTLVAATSILVFGCASTSNNASLNATTQPNIENIKAHMHFLADDLLEGRETGSRGHEIASLYIAGEFAKYGLKPGGDDGTYIQRINFRKGLLVQESPTFSVESDSGESFEFSYPDDFLSGPNLVAEEATITAPIVFVGYGISAPELDHDDYAGIDVEGKIVLALSGKPKSFPSELGSHLASGANKSKYAAERGAVGYVTIPSPQREAARPYKNMMNYIFSPRMRWVQDDGNPSSVEPGLVGSAYLSPPAIEKLFALGSTPISEVHAQLENDEVPSAFDIPATITLSRETTHENLSSPNVVGILEGSDPVLKNEYVVYTAHSDHIGISKSVEKDKINNGAMDNASGTSVLMETARMFASLPTPPKRSIIFLAVTGEEKGLLGADYFARNPTVPQENLIANVNLDMPILTFEFADVIAFGADHSSMKASVEAATKNVGITLSDDPWPELNLFTRSDHYSFVKQGIPAVFLVPGIQSKDPEIDGSKVLQNFLGTNYHRPGDDMTQPFKWNAATTFTEVNFQIGLTLANQAERPTWNEGDFFGDTFSKK